MESLDVVWERPVDWKLGGVSSDRAVEIGCCMGRDSAPLDVGLKLHLVDWGGYMDRECQGWILRRMGEIWLSKVVGYWCKF